MSINSLSKNKEAAWDFIEYLCTEPGATKLASLGTLPAYKTPSILDLLSQVEGFPKECKDNLDVRSVQLEIPPHDQSAAIDKILNEEHELIMLGAISIDEGIQNMNERVQEILKK
jgi:multiple sugar transport system substrate-binding protein